MTGNLVIDNVVGWMQVQIHFLYNLYYIFYRVQLSSPRPPLFIQPQFQSVAIITAPLIMI